MWDVEDNIEDNIDSGRGQCPTWWTTRDVMDNEVDDGERGGQQEATAL